MSRRSTGGGDPDPASSTRLLKSRHLAGNPFVSLAYIADVAKPAYADCRAEWVNDSTMLRHVWDLCLRPPPPLGFDPAPIYGSVEEPRAGGPMFGVLKLIPYRILLSQWPTPPTIWTPAGGSDSTGVAGQSSPAGG